MQDKPETSSQLQFNFDIESPVDSKAARPVTSSNVVRIKFGSGAARETKRSEEDSAILEKVLLNARKLHW